MANLKSGKITGTGDYVNIETELSLNLEEGKKYSVQIQGNAVICESENKPENGSGFFWNNFRPFGYKKESAYLWVKVNSGYSVFVNIAE